MAFHTDYFMHRAGVVMAVGAIADPELTGLDPDTIGRGGCCCEGGKGRDGEKMAVCPVRCSRSERGDSGKVVYMMTMGGVYARVSGK